MKKIYQDYFKVTSLYDSGCIELGPHAYLY